MVAAMTSYLYLLLIKSAALRKMAARSAKGRVSHCAFAASAASIAFETSSSLALEYVAMAVAWSDGLD